MRSERQAVATQYRADGQKRARTITAEAQRKATVIEAQAYEEAQKIRGEGMPKPCGFTPRLTTPTPSSTASGKH